MDEKLAGSTRHRSARRVFVVRFTALVALLTLAAMAPVAGAAGQSGTATSSSAGSLVYLKNNNIWVSRVDGTGARQVTSGNKWFMPSQSDNGTIVAET